MVKIKELVMPESLDEAYELFIAKRSSRIIGGGAFLRLGNATILKGVDLSKLALDYINQYEDKIEIGAMTTLYDVETSPILKDNFSGALSKCVKNIVGVQLRNIATIGGSVVGKYGFSDILPVLLALDATLIFYKQGEISLENYLNFENFQRDILEKIVIKKDKKASFQMMRNSDSDFSILNACVCFDDRGYTVVVGSTPGVAKICKKNK
ncbi:MAG: FAD binding domain-containing protein [Lachnospirales bacterium]